MSEQHSDFLKQQEDLLQSALSTAFAPVTLSSSTSTSSGSTPKTSEASTSALSEPGASSSIASAGSSELVPPEELAKWSEEYTSLERSWKAESAARRAEIDARNARGESWERLEGLRGPPNPLLHPTSSGYPGSPSPADVRDRVTGEPTGQPKSEKGKELESSPEKPSPPPSTALSQSQRWEEVGDSDLPSIESSASFPSLSFPSQSEGTSPPSQPHTRGHTSSRSAAVLSGHDNHGHGSGPARHPIPPSASVAIFDSRLPTSTRVRAFVAALAINVLLPFVNGVMLGVGEIFARGVAARFGWGLRVSVPGGAATVVGIRSARSNKTEAEIERRQA